MAKQQKIKHFFVGTLDDLWDSGVRYEETIEYLLDQRPIWLLMGQDKNFWTGRLGLAKMVSCTHSEDLYERYLSGMMLPKRLLKPLERREVMKYGNRRLREEYGL